MSTVIDQFRRGPWRPATLGLPERAKVSEHVAGRLRRWRLAAGMSEQMAAELTQRTVEDLEQIEGGVVEVSIVDFLVFGEIYGASCTELLDGDIPRRPGKKLREQLDFAREVASLPRRLQRACKSFVVSLKEELKSGGQEVADV